MENFTELEKELGILQAAEDILRKRLGKIFNFGGSCQDLLREITAIKWKMAEYRMAQKRQKEAENA